MEFTLERFLLQEPGANCVAIRETPHEVLKNADPIKVYVSTEISKSGETKTYFSLFNGQRFVGNSLVFYQEVPYEYYKVIGETMINELLSISDFTDLDRELEGKCACLEYEGIYKSCDECPEYRYGKGKDSDNSCMGAMYSIPSHRNGWDCERKFLKIFGKGTRYYKDYQRRLFRDHLYELKQLCSENPSLKREFKKELKSLSRNFL